MCQAVNADSLLTVGGTAGVALQCDLRPSYPGNIRAREDASLPSGVHRHGNPTWAQHQETG